ncbi:hypothetical protein TNCV_4910361 [Trichonephila clavipes]|nr:hypothetical protein TNCV_4910361 [Trichonephila clavipes]
MKPSRVPESPLKDPVNSKPQIITKSPDPPVKKAHVKKVDSVIHRSPRSRERRNEERRPRDPRMYRRSVSKAGFQTQSVSETPLRTAINAHFPGKCPSLLSQPSEDSMNAAVHEAVIANDNNSNIAVAVDGTWHKKELFFIEWSVYVLRLLRTERLSTLKLSQNIVLHLSKQHEAYYRPGKSFA